MITVVIFDPLAAGDLPIVTYEPVSYTHEIHAVGGYWSARVRIDAAQVDMAAWYETGLDRRIVVYSPDNVTVWEGFVNAIKLKQGRHTRTIGSVLGIANRVRVVYSLMSGGVDTGISSITSAADDAASQARYGILERIVSAGAVTATEAAQIRDQYLAENAQLPPSEEWTLGSERASMELDCVGYARRMEAYTYTNTAITTGNLSAKIAAVLDADPNAILSSANAQIEANTLQVPANDVDNRTAWNVVKSLTAQGSSTFGRTVFGVYAGRQAQYRTVANQIDYRQSIADSGRQVQTAGGATVQPWYVLPGKWVLMDDMVIGRIADSADLRDDPRFMFVESVQYIAPYTLNLRGGKRDTVEQRLGMLGLMGV